MNTLVVSVLVPLRLIDDDSLMLFDARYVARLLSLDRLAYCVRLIRHVSNRLVLASVVADQLADDAV